MSGMDLKEVTNLLNNYYKTNEKKTPSWDLYFVSMKTEIPGDFRIVPYRHAKHPFIEIKQHCNIAGERALICPKHYNGSECPICDLADTFLANASFQLPNGKDRPEADRKANWQIFTTLQASPKFHVPVISRSAPEKGVRLIGFSQGLLLKLLEFSKDPDWGDYVDPITGNDIKFSHIQQKDGKKMLSASLKPRKTRLAETDEEIQKIIESVPNYFDCDPPAFDVKTKAQLTEILSRFGKTSSESEVTISAAPAKPADDSIGVDIKLDAFLKG